MLFVCHVEVVVTSDTSTQLLRENKDVIKLQTAADTVVTGKPGNFSPDCIPLWSWSRFSTSVLHAGNEVYIEVMYMRLTIII